jgi:hypothetical protein
MAEMTFSTIAIIIAIIAQTIAIGFFIGSIKTVVDRLVKDVEKISRDIIDGFKEAQNEVKEAKTSIVVITNTQLIHETKIESLITRVNYLEHKQNDMSN